MLLTGPEGLKALTTAYETGRALPGFVAYNLETVQGIVAAAEANPESPVLIQAGSSAFKHAGRDALTRLALDAAAASPPRSASTWTTAATSTRSPPASRPATPP